jgi:hypothetical protein
VKHTSFASAKVENLKKTAVSKNLTPQTLPQTLNQLGCLVGWLMESLYSYAGGDTHKDGASNP